MWIERTSRKSLWLFAPWHDCYRILEEWDDPYWPLQTYFCCRSVYDGQTPPHVSPFHFTLSYFLASSFIVNCGFFLLLGLWMAWCITECLTALRLLVVTCTSTSSSQALWHWSPTPHLPGDVTGLSFTIMLCEPSAIQGPVIESSYRFRSWS